MNSKIILEMKERLANGLVQYCRMNGMTRAGFIRKLVYDRICEHQEEFERSLRCFEPKIKEEMEYICRQGLTQTDMDA